MTILAEALGAALLALLAAAVKRMRDTARA